jgi:transcriptional regulator with XRE-family HTH domain
LEKPKLLKSNSGAKEPTDVDQALERTRKKMTPEQIARSNEKAEAMRIGMLIHQLRQSNGLTQQALADKLGTTQQAVSKMERGEETQLSSLQNVIAALGGNIVIQMQDQVISLSSVCRPVARIDYSLSRKRIGIIQRKFTPNVPSIFHPHRRK